MQRCFYFYFYFFILILININNINCTCSDIVDNSDNCVFITYSEINCVNSVFFYALNNGDCSSVTGNQKSYEYSMESGYQLRAHGPTSGICDSQSRIHDWVSPGYDSDRTNTYVGCICCPSENLM